MPARSTRAQRYAEAVFQVARDHGSFDVWLRQLGEAEQIMADPLAAQVLLSPAVPRDRKSRILSRTMPDLDPMVRRFVDLMLRRNALQFLPQVLERLRKLIDAELGVATARVTTAVPLGASERELLQARLSARTGRRIRIEESVDPDILGGVVAQVGDEIIDGSVRGRLNRLRRALVGT